MAGRMGNEKVMMQGLYVSARCFVEEPQVFSVHPKKNVIAVIGGVPGPYGGMVKVKDTPWFKFLKPPPFPTWTKEVPDKDVIQGRFLKNPWSQDPNIKHPSVLKQVLAAQEKKASEIVFSETFWNRLYRESSIAPARRLPTELSPKMIQEGQEILERKKKEAEELQQGKPAQAAENAEKKAAPGQPSKTEGKTAPSQPAKPAPAQAAKPAPAQPAKPAPAQPKKDEKKK